MHEIVDIIFMCATEFMHDSSLCMDEDHVGKQQDLYLWCFVGGSKNWGLWGCPMLFTSGCPCTISIPVVPAPSALQRRGIISLFSFMDTIIRGAILARIGLGASQFQPLEDISCITVPVEIPKIDFFFTFSKISSLPFHRRADEDQWVIRRASSNVAFNILYASVMGNPVMDELSCEESRRCYDRCALLGYSSYDSDNDWRNL